MGVERVELKCDRCGEAFSYKYPLTYKQANTPNAIVRVKNDGSGTWDTLYDYEDSITLCPSCMAALNDWLKGKQK